MSSKTPRKILVTSALPYANGSIHLGHLVEYIQTDIWVRFQKMRGNSCHYVCADDTHGTPIMLRAEKEGITPEQLIARVWQEHYDDFAAFHVAFDNYGSTNSTETKESAQGIYRTLKANGLIEVRSIEQYYDPVKNMFLPDRFIKGECPKCHAKDQYGDNCEVCGAAYAPTDLIDPFSAVSGAKPELRNSDHYFFKLSADSCQRFLREWTRSGSLQAEAANKMQEWLGAEGENKLTDWDISRDAPYFGFEIPDAPGKYFYVWLDAPVGYMGSFKQLCGEERHRLRRLLETRLGCRAVPLHRQGHPVFPRAVLAGDAAARRLPHADQTVRARLPHRERREDEQVARHLHHRAQLHRPHQEHRIPALLLRRQAERHDGRHRPQPRGLRGEGEQRPDRQVHQYCEP